MAVNINGYDLSNNSGLAFGTSTSKINTNGQLISPASPIVFGSKNTGSGAVVSQYPWSVNSTTVNVNTVWTSNTTYTCPVAGVYYAAWSGICQGGAWNGYGGLVKNGGLTGYWAWSTNDAWDTCNFQVILGCSAGDTLAWAVNIAPSPVGASPGAYDSNHNMMTIWLIG